MKKITQLILISLILIAITSCSKKSDNKPNVATLKTPTLTTLDISSITRNSALSGGVITNDGGSTVISRGVIWSTTQNPTISLTTKTSDSTVVGSNGYTSYLSGLAPNTTYYVVAYATNSVGTSYGNQISFKTSSSASMPTLSTSAVSSITGTTAISGGNVTDDGGSSITAEGVIWSTSLNVTTASTKTNDGTAVGNFTSKLSALTPNTTYYVIAYATNSVGTAYGNQFSFKTSSASIPTLSTGAVSSITGTAAVIGVSVTSDGGSPVIARGVTWTSIQTVGLGHNGLTPSRTSDGTGTGSFTSSLSGLQPATIYYAWAYATNSVGTAYGDLVTFKTSSASTPILTTTAISNATTSTATSGGNVTSDGGSSVTAKGIVWSTSPNPTIALTTKTSDGSGTGSFTSSLSGLAPNTTYYVVAYATNSAGTAYGNQISFKTSTSVFLPILTTTAISNATTSTATSGGNVTSDGGSPITARGIIWSTDAILPITLATKTNDGIGTGSFTSSLSGLAPNTTYHVVAYATNSAGTAYGNIITFTTL